MPAKRSAKKAAAKPSPKPAADPISAILEKPLLGDGNDPRPRAWLSILEARVKHEHPPRELRVYEDDRFTGTKRVAQAQALTYIGVTPEDAAGIIVREAMGEHRGDKHCDW